MADRVKSIGEAGTQGAVICGRGTDGPSHDNLAESGRVREGGAALPRRPRIVVRSGQRSSTERNSTRLERTRST